MYRRPRNTLTGLFRGNLLAHTHHIMQEAVDILVPRSVVVEGAAKPMLALAGCGITRLPELCQAELDAGTLETILPNSRPPSIGINVIYASRDNLPAKIRAMIDFLVE